MKNNFKMGGITKKELGKIQQAAFEQFKSQYTDAEWRILFSGGVGILTVWKISEGKKVKMIITNTDYQMNWNTLKYYNFTKNAEVKKLFFVDQTTKQLVFT